MSEKQMPACRQCGGTGKVILYKSAFPADGTRKERCGICGGTGVSSYRGDREFNKHQAALRARHFGIEGGKPNTTEVG